MRKGAAGTAPRGEGRDGVLLCGPICSQAFEAGGAVAPFLLGWLPNIGELSLAHS